MPFLSFQEGGKKCIMSNDFVALDFLIDCCIL